MTSRTWLRLAEILVSALLAVVIMTAWQSDRRNRAQVAAQLAATQVSIAEASASQHARDKLLSQTLERIAAQKRAASTPAELLKALPKAIPLPSPIVLQTQGLPTKASTPPAIKPSMDNTPAHTTPPLSTSDSTEQSAQSRPLPSNPTPQSARTPDAILPANDLKPLYDFALDCQACQARLATAQSDLNDERGKTATLTKERDAAIRAAKGGSALRRIARAAKWFILGAAAGAIAAKAAH